MDPVAAPGLGEFSLIQSAMGLEIDAIEHGIVIIDGNPHMRRVGHGGDDLVEWHQHDVQVPRNRLLAEIAACRHDEAEIAGRNFIERGNDAPIGLCIAARMKEGKMGRIKAPLQGLQPIAFLNMAARVSIILGNQRPFEIREGRCLPRTHVGPDKTRALDAGIGGRA